MSDAGSALIPLDNLPVEEASENTGLEDLRVPHLMALLWTVLFFDLGFPICSMRITYQLHGVAVKIKQNNLCESDS